MKYLLSSIVILFSAVGGHCRAEGVSESSLVKVFSGRCGSEKVGFRGSGFVFRDGEQNYVLTSEHVVVHNNKDFCHLIWNETFGEIKAELVAADWGYGLGLLKLPRLADQESFQNRTIFDSDVKSGKITTWGYPYGAESLVSDHYGRILLAKSERNLIPIVDYMTEVIEAHGEYGMSGGVVTENKTGQLVGLLSHQYIVKPPGRPAAVAEWEESHTTVENHLLVIASSTIKKWLSLILDKKKSASMQRLASSQISGDKVVIVSGGLCFIQSKADSEEPTGGIGGGDGTGIGGGDGTGIGGGDGTGVGGDAEEGSANKNHIQIKITRCSSGAASGHWPIAIKQSWFDAVNTRLLRRAKISVPYFISYDGGQSGLKKKYFKTLAEFFSLLNEKECLPATIQTHLGVNDTGLVGILAELKEGGDWLTEHLKDLTINLNDQSVLDGDMSALHSRELVKQINTLADLLSRQSWEIVPNAWVSDLIHKNKDGWKYLFNNHFDITVETLSKLKRINHSLRKVKL